MAKTNNKMSKKDAYALVTERILGQLNKGIIPWEKDWFGTGHKAYNRVSKKDYSFLNQILVTESGEYASFKQWQEAGAKVKKGEKASQVVFWKLLDVEKTDKDTGEAYTTTIPFLKYSNVFHISQVEPIFEDKPILPVRDIEETPENPDERILDGDEVIQTYMDREGITFHETDSDVAYYSPSTDKINVPNFEQFKSAPGYYATLLHEMTHSTGHPKRLDRKMSGRFGSESYSFEELVAELGSAMLMAQIGIKTDKTERNSVAYIQSWIQVLQNDEKAFVRAASLAEKAAKFILNGEKPNKYKEEKSKAHRKTDEVKAPEVVVPAEPVTGVAAAS